VKPSELNATSRGAILSAKVLNEIADERKRAEAKFPNQHLPFGTGLDGDRDLAEHAKASTDLAAKEGSLTWRHVIREEFYEAMAETDPRRLHDELVQLANTAMRAAEDALLAEDADLW
jgi:hypothetical protein